MLSVVVNAGMAAKKKKFLTTLGNKLTNFSALESSSHKR